MMKTTRFSSLLFACAGFLAALPGSVRAGEERDRLVLVESGASSYVIALAEEGLAHEPETREHIARRRAISASVPSVPSRIGEAARLLADVVEQATGVVLPVMAESDVPEGTPALYLGRSDAARRGGLPVDDVTGWRYLNRVVGRDVYLVGEDVPPRIEGSRVGYLGSLRAVSAFLEREAGVRFVLPGSQGRHVPRTDRLTVDAALDQSGMPVFEYIGGAVHSLWTNQRSVGRRDDRVYAVAMNLTPEPVFASYGGHSYNHAVPRDIYFENHPEYFAVSGGERTGGGGAHAGIHLCISNPDVHELMLAEMERQLDLGHDWVLLGQTDGYQECQCEDCQAIHPDRGEKIWIVHRMLAEEMQRRRPGKKVVLLSYVWTTPPPTSFDRFPENVMIMTNRFQPVIFEAWRDWNVPMIVYNPLWMGHIPRISPRYAVDQVRLFLIHDVRGIYFGGGYDRALCPWGLNGPSYYAMGKAMANPAVNADALVEEYVEAAFGAAAEPMLDFFTTMHRRLEVNALLLQWDVGQPDRRFRGYPFATKPGDFLCHFFPPSVLADMRAALDRARSMSLEPEEAARLDLVEGEFRYLHDVAVVYHLYRAYRLSPGWEALALLKPKVDAYRETLAWLYPDGQARPMPGLRAPYNGQSGRKISAGGAPFDWDFDALRNSGSLPRIRVRERTRGGTALESLYYEDE